MSSSAEWTDRIGSRGAQLRRTYLLWRVALLVAIPAYWVCAVGVGALHLNLSVPAVIAIVIVSSVAVAGGIVRAQVVSRRKLVTEILQHARLPEAGIADRSIGSIAGYDNWIGRVSHLARPTP